MGWPPGLSTVRGRLGLEDAEVPWPPAGSAPCPAPPCVQETWPLGASEQQGRVGGGFSRSVTSHGGSPSREDGQGRKSHERATSQCGGHEPGHRAHVGPLQKTPKVGALGNTCSTSRAAVLWPRGLKPRELEERGRTAGRHGRSCPLVRRGLRDVCAPCRGASASRRCLVR